LLSASFHPRLHNLKHSLHNIRFFNPSFLFRCIPRQDALHKETGRARDCVTFAALTTNHLP
jgi:hypothetical protein